MTHLKQSANAVWLRLLSDIRRDGSPCKPRDMDTLELIGNQTVTHMKHPMITVKQRKVSYPFMFAEAWWMLSGRDDVAALLPYSPSIGRFSDDGETFAGAYGPRIMSQMKYVIETIVKDKVSRQATLTIYSPNPEPSKDIPCTLSLQFILRDGYLNCVASMRSSDAWIGFIYDVFNFSAITAYVMLELRQMLSQRIELGDLYLTAGSQHLYSNKYEKAREIMRSAPSDSYADTFAKPPFNFEELVDKCKSGEEFVLILGELKDHIYETN